MKNCLLIIALLGCLLPLHSQITYVKQDATGSNNGTSWANAYTSLQQALDNTTSGQIWIAEGTYLPEGSDSLATFFVSTSVELYGGFFGFETDLSQRLDPALQSAPTVLSGDLLGNDLEGNFDFGKDDNVLHVLVIDSLIGGAVVLDGLIIQGGHTADDNTLPDAYWRGGGVLAYSAVEVRKSQFRNNFARTGASLCVEQVAGLAIVEDCTFSKNKTSNQSAGIYCEALGSLSVTASNFTQNETVRGALYPLRCNNVLIKDCTFEENNNQDGFGGAMFIWNCTNFLMQDCQFSYNQAANAGAVHIDGRELFTDPENHIIENCTFSFNSASSNGGALRSNDADHIVRNCTFENNTSTSSGGHMFLSNDLHTSRIIDCAFMFGKSEGGWGGGSTCYGDSANYYFTGCQFENNTCQNSGSALYAGFGAFLSIDSCAFEGNENFDGIGTVAGQNDYTLIAVTGSDFNFNNSNSSGGALAGNITNSSISILASNCNFFGNNSVAGVGGAISLSENGGKDLSNLEVTNSTFVFNTSQDQGGAVNLTNSDAVFTNCVFYSNTAKGEGIGGALSINASDSNEVKTFLINNTFLFNSGSLAGGIAHWTGTSAAVSTLELQNNILQNDINYVIEAGTPIALSLGGNFDGTGGSTSILDHPADIVGFDAMIVDPLEYDFQLKQNSPCIDAGVADGAPAQDRAGNDRDAIPDIGAYEYQDATGTAEIVRNSGRLWVFPNPVATVMNVQVDNDWRGTLSFVVTDPLGRVIKSWIDSKGADREQWTISPMGLESGVYHLHVSDGTEAMVTTFFRK